MTAINKPETQRNGGDDITLALWAIGWIVITVSLAFLARPEVQGCVHRLRIAVHYYVRLLPPQPEVIHDIGS